VIRALRNERSVAARGIIERWRQSTRNAASQRTITSMHQRQALPILRLRDALD
jgi:hypothetical protein